MINSVLLNRKDIKTIQSILDQFKEVENFSLVIDKSSPIGYHLKMIVDLEVNDVVGEFTIPIVSEKDW
jgi:hypothetical protein